MGGVENLSKPNIAKAIQSDIFQTPWADDSEGLLPGQQDPGGRILPPTVSSQEATDYADRWEDPDFSGSGG